MRKLLPKLHLTSFVAGLLLMFLLSGITALASTRTQTINVTFRGIRIVINDETVTPRDAAGNVVEPFIWEGTTYLPLRAVADAMGLTPSWDGSTSTVYLVDSNAPSDVREPATVVEDTNTIVGTWYWFGIPLYVFRADGSGLVLFEDDDDRDTFEIRWTSNNGILTICVTPDSDECADGCVDPIEWSYVLVGNALTLRNDNEEDSNYTLVRR